MDTALKLVITRIITTAAKRRASDIHFVAGSRPILRIDDELMELKQEEIVTDVFLKKFIDDVADDLQKKTLQKEKSVSFVYVFEDKLRIRVNVYYQKDTFTMSLKLIPLRIPSVRDLGLPKAVAQLAEETRGLIIISGPYGSGKTTTAASLVDEINKTRSENILTIEKPIEYIFFNNKSVVEQREVGRDVNSFFDALRDCEQEDVDVILVGENEDEELIPDILDLALSGRLVFFLMRSITVIQVIEKIFASFPLEQQTRVREMLSSALRGIVVQRLLPRIGGGKAAAFEILLPTPAVISLLREGKFQQLKSVMQTSLDEGMTTLDQSLARLVRSGEVSYSHAVEEAIDKENFSSMAK